jgi:hypothetical protein
VQLQANHTMTTTTLGRQITNIEMAFKNMTTQLAATPVSSGSTTVSPTNDEVSITLSDAMQSVVSNCNGI